MKRAARILCLLLSITLLLGCAPQGATENPTTAPESSGAELDIQETQLAVLISIPIALLFMYTQKFYQEAMSGGVKG